MNEELWKQAPVLTGSTKFEPLSGTKSILVTGGAGFMYVNCKAILQEVAECATLQAVARFL